MKVVYIAGPYTGDHARNVRQALEVANVLADAGYAPIVPHLTHFWDMIFPRPYEDWLRIDKAHLAVCDCLYRIPGNSFGADGEEEEAHRLGIPVYYHLTELLNERKTSP